MNKLRRIFTKSVFQMDKDGTHLVPEECESFLYAGPVAEAGILYAADSVIPGELIYPNAPNVIETVALASATPFSNSGLPGKLSSGAFVPITTTGDAVYGILMRVYPEQGLNAADPYNVAAPKLTGPASALITGYIGVFCQGGTPAQGGSVYIRFQNPSGAKIVGGFEASSGADVYQLTGAIFMSAADSKGNVGMRLGSTTI